MAAALKGIDLGSVRPFGALQQRLSDAGYRPKYVFIEPRYDALRDYKAGNSPRPLAERDWRAKTD